MLSWSYTEHAFLTKSMVPVNRGVVVDTHLQTSVSDVYAAGDVAEYYDSRIGQHRLVGTWANALLQESAGANGRRLSSLAQ